MSSPAYGRGIYYGWWLVAVCIFVQSVGLGTSIYMYSVSAGAFGAAFPSGRTVLMLGASVLFVMAAVMSPKVGSLLDRYSIKWVMITGAITMGVGFILIALSTNIWQVIFCYALFIAVGMATLSPLSSSTLLCRWFVANRGFALGLAALGTQFGGLIYPPIVAHLIELYDWRIAFGALGLFILLVLPVCVYYFVVDRPDSDQAPSAEAATAAMPGAGSAELSLWRLFTDRTFLLIVLIFGFINVTNASLLANLSLFAVEVGVVGTRAALLVSLLSVLGMLSSPLVGRLSDLFDVRLVTMSVILFLTGAVLVFLAADSYALLLIATFFLGLAGGGIFPSWAATVARTYGPAVFGRVMGATVMVIYMVIATGPIIAGRVYDATGSYQLLFLLMLAMMCVIVPLLALIPVRQGPTGRAIETAPAGAGGQ